MQGHCESKLDEIFIENSQDDIADVIYTYLVRQVPQGVASIQALIKHMQGTIIEHVFKGDKQKFMKMCDNDGVLLPILANYAAEFTSKIEGFDLDSRIFPKVLVDNEQTAIRNVIAVEMCKGK